MVTTTTSSDESNNNDDNNNSSSSNSKLRFASLEDTREVIEKVDMLLGAIVRIAHKMTSPDHPHYQTQLFLNFNTATLQVIDIIASKAMRSQILAVLAVQKKQEQQEQQEEEGKQSQ